MSSLDFAVVPDINQPETLDIQNESPSPRSNLHYRNMQEYLGIPFRTHLVFTNELYRISCLSL
jgi:hypothetical protein